MNGSMLVSIYVFVLACFAGYQLISKVPPTLHTPLMSGSNFIAGIIILGALDVACAHDDFSSGFYNFIGCLAVICATVNVAGGWIVTERMLMMFKRKG